MSGRVCIVRTICKPLMQSLFAIAMLLSLAHVDIINAQHHRSESWREKHVESDFLSQTTRTVRTTVEGLIGKHNFKMLSEVKMVPYKVVAMYLWEGSTCELNCSFLGVLVETRPLYCAYREDMMECFSSVVQGKPPHLTVES